jgi:prophage regulatory protein
MTEKIIKQHEETDEPEYHHLPTTGLLRLRQVLQAIAMSKSWVYAEIKQKRFPRGVSVGPRARRWRAEDIRHYIADPTRFRGR